MQSRLVRCLCDAVASCTAADNRITCHLIESYTRGSFSRYIIAVVVKGKNPECDRRHLLEVIDGNEMPNGQIESRLDSATYTLSIIEVPDDRMHLHIPHGPRALPRFAV